MSIVGIENNELFSVCYIISTLLLVVVIRVIFQICDLKISFILFSPLILPCHLLVLINQKSICILVDFTIPANRSKIQ